MFEPAELTPLPFEKQKLPFEDRGIRLADAIATALQHSDVVRVMDGGAVFVSPSTAYDVAAREADRDAAYATFDPKISAGYIGSKINEPPSSFFGPGISQQTRRDEGQFTAALSSLMQTGATASLSYAPPLGYLFIPNGDTSLFNPIYSAAIVAEARQPLLRGAGLEVNRAPLRIAQLRLEQSTWELKQAVLAQVRSVEEAYWDLQSAYILLQAVDSVIPLAEEAVRIERERLASEMAIRADVARAQVQLAQFRQQRIRYEAAARDRENRLRNLIGLPAVDGGRLVPVDPPRQLRPELDADAALAAALGNRPDLVQRRLSLRIRELECLVAQNNLKPQVDLQALYRANGVGQQLDDAIHQAGILDYTDWTLGMTFSMPLGNRAAKAAWRAKEAQLARERALLRETVRNLGYRISDLIRESTSAWDQYEQTRERVAACQEWLQASRVRFAFPPPNLQSPDALLLLLYDYQTALRAYVEAVGDASVLLAGYNGSLARLEEVQGTLLDSRAIQLADDPVAAVRQYPALLNPVSPAVAPPANAPDPSAGGGWSAPAAPAFDPAADYRRPDSGYRSPFGGGWSTPPNAGPAAEPSLQALPPPAPPIDPAGNYRAPASFLGSPFGSGWSPPAPPAGPGRD